MSAEEELHSEFTLEQIQQYQVDTPSVWQARIDREAEKQNELQSMPSQERHPVKDLLNNKKVRAALVTAGVALAGLTAFFVGCDNNNRIIPPPTKTPEPGPTQTLNPSPTERPTVQPSPTRLFPSPTATEQARWQPHFTQDRTLAKGETFWSNNYQTATGFLHTYHKDRYYMVEGEQEVLTAEGKRVATAMTDGATVKTLLDNNVTVAGAHSLEYNFPYKGPTIDTMIVMYAGVLGEEDSEIPVDPQELSAFTSMAQTINFDGYDDLTPDQLALATKVNSELQQFEQNP